MNSESIKPTVYQVPGGFMEKVELADGAINYTKYEGDWNTIKWLMDILDEQNDKIGNLEFRLAHIEKTLKEVLPHILSIMEESDRAEDELQNQINNLTKYTTKSLNEKLNRKRNLNKYNTYT